jgi:hypothetical protein
MRDLTYIERIKLTILVQEIISAAHCDEELENLHLEALKLVHGNKNEIEQWLEINTQENIEKLNKVIMDLNQHLKMNIQAEKFLLSAKNKFYADFQGADEDLKQATRFLSGDPEKYDQYEREVQAYFDTDHAKDIVRVKNLGEEADHGEDISDKKQFIKNTQSIVDNIFTCLMAGSPEFNVADMSTLSLH